MEESVIWDIIDKYFKENPDSLVSHHIDSYNDFFKNGIFQIFKEKNPVRISSNYDDRIGDYRNQCLMYFGGKNGDKIYFGKPIIYDDKDNSHYMFPNEARLRNMTYGMTIHYDIDVEYIDVLEEGEHPYIVGESGVVLDEETEKREDYETKTDFENFKEKGVLVGGAPKATLPPKRKKNSRKQFAVTPAMAAAMREATEKTMVEPHVQKRIIPIKNVYLGKFPIMVQSDFCILKGLSPEVRHTMGECRRDLGGYFIIQGKEKTIICQEKFADNMMYIRKYDDDGASEYLFSCEMRSVSENVSKPIRTLSVKIVAPTASYTNKNIVVNIPNVRQPVPLFIVFRALGVVTDKAIVEMCLLDLDKYEHMTDIFAPSVHDAGAIMTQRQAVEYIALLTKGKRVEHTLEILADYFLPHIGETNFMEKAYFLGHMVFRLLSAHTGIEQPTDRDNFKYKRIELVGSLLGDLFREYYSDQQKFIQVEYDKRLTLNRSLYANDLHFLVQTYQSELFKERVLEVGFTKAFKGNWGARPNTKRIGVIQDLNRLSFNSYLSHLRKTNLPMDSGAKLVGPRVLHGSQWGYIDPIDTPDGGNIGLHKSLAISTHVTRDTKGMRDQLVLWLREKMSLKFVEECTPRLLSTLTKVFVNGFWAGSLAEPLECVQKFRLYRRNSLIPIHTSITFEIKTNTIYIYSDGGRLIRPILYKDDLTKQLSWENPNITKALKSGEYTWRDLTTGFNAKRKDAITNDAKVFELFELYEGINAETNPAKLDRFLNKKAIIDYIDSSESEDALIAMNQEEYPKKKYTHMEIHESLIFGSMCNLINFPENNPPTRNSFSCGQSKQACSMYHTNHRVRMDKTAVVLNNGQIPLVKSRYMEYINGEEMPYGENAIVAIMCYSGYNMEDSILINEGSLKRGLFNTTYYTTYETHEEINKSGDETSETKFANIEQTPGIVGTKPGYDYSKLDDYGLIREGTEVDDKSVLIGAATTQAGKTVDASKTPKKGQLGIVDKTFITEGEEGERIAKVRIREIRIPNQGDKLASRAGQKGTVGLVVPECDMPFTSNGLRPDMVINPHAIPSRMTIGQLIECVMGKACAMMGGFGDCTAFVNKGSKVGVFGEALVNVGFHSSGNEILYNGMSGEQLESEIFIGPTYYMRLKHMTKDKINYRALGPRTALTKQPVSGRANDGGLRIGEMERDSVASHGIVNFLTESMMERGDKYKVAVCNTTGLFAIYNPAKNLFLSPMADGPIKFVGSLDGKDMNIENVSKYGRSFSVISVPYSFKLLIQELQTINVQMRIITADNIDQIESMSFSRNLENLTGTMAANVLKHTIQTKLDKKQGADIEAIMPSSPDFATPNYDTPTIESPVYLPTTPDTTPPALSPGYPPVSYNVGTEVTYKGDLRKWTIIETGGDDAVKIQSDDGTVKLANKGNLYAFSSPPQYVPRTPENTPPASSVGYPPDSYNVGTIVKYKGDLNKWTIVETGDNIIKIQNANGDTKLANKFDLFASEPTSPRYEPTSPSLETAPQPTSSSYDVGTAVQYKGDGLIYTIVKVSDTLLTIQNEKGESKLVDRTELYAPPTQQAPLIVGGGAASGTNMYFAPSIVINGGDAMKSVTSGAGTGAIVGSGAGTVVVDPTPKSGGAIDFSRLVVKKNGA
jgi:DNA-directed RNA polymerase II subunit RPB2